jgi:hypothetical protein
MKSTGKFISFIILSVILISSCAKEPDAGFPDDGVYLIKRVTYKGETRNKFLYNPNGKIAEAQSFYYCERFTYDDNDRLVKVEEAYNFGTSETNGIMTSQNSTFIWYRTYEYDLNGRLMYIKLYRENGSAYEYSFTTSLDYENGNIVRKNKLNAAGDSITQFIAYEYDDKRNLINEKHYSNIFIDGPGPELQYEFTYKYDNKNNPYIICKETGCPGLYSNANNTIESNLIIYNDNPETQKYSTRTVSYEYNAKGFPVKQIVKEKIGTTVYEYVYD